MAIRTIVVHDLCTVASCKRHLYSVVEAERGICGLCYLRQLPAAVQQSINRLTLAIFQQTDPDEIRGRLIEEVLCTMRENGEIPAPKTEWLGE